MLVFKKELMLKRLERANQLDKVSVDLLKLMNELDGKKVHVNKGLTISGLQYVVYDNEGTSYPIHSSDMADVVIVPKRDEVVVTLRRKGECR